MEQGYGIKKRETPLNSWVSNFVQIFFEDKLKEGKHFWILGSQIFSNFLKKNVGKNWKSFGTSEWWFEGPFTLSESERQKEIGRVTIRAFVNKQQHKNDKSDNNNILYHKHPCIHLRKDSAHYQLFVI